ncbi:CBS domain-containing protein [Tuanshanicoccus lijuaniae]|uniref:cyclic-di-AMP-binding protein CbpB n=1 Tax=Aerococcaceae bacterium zg-1292 TaxID=2774330 RepID=UPI001934FD44|nr:CBS domain-containing protein [Aerococcaceae bacterium zg-1292]QQA37802.1 CBS domain-containing protein [Aerococcaceae bacterium zg-1292]
MINKIIEKSIVSSISDLMIPADNVAHVLSNNTLSHGLLVLSTVKYSLIPVLSPQLKLMGLLNMSVIIKAITTIDAIEVSKLDEITIESVMMKPPVVLDEQVSFEKVLHYLVDYNFLCVVDKDQNFKGIITRRAVLKRLNKFIHQLSTTDALRHLLVQVAKNDQQDDI